VRNIGLDDGRRDSCDHGQRVERHAWRGRMLDKTEKGTGITMLQRQCLRHVCDCEECHKESNAAIVGCLAETIDSTVS
jgi:hypothetical protein